MTVKKWTVLKLMLLVLVTGLIVTMGGTGALAARQDCWMTGGGSIFNTEYGGDDRFTHGFVVHCTPRNSDNLQVKDHASGVAFHMTNLESAICIDDPAIEPNPPDASFDTFVGQGSGRCNFPNDPGNDAPCTVRFTFTDGGERGGCIRDTAIIEVRDANGNVVIAVSGDVDCGNHQAHSK
jgi:hypothetical protein